MADPVLSIGDVAGSCHVAPSALRYWEAQGLLHPDHTPAGYRQYDPEQVARVRFIQRGQALGLSLSEIRDLLHAADGDGEAEVRNRLRHLLAHKLADTHRQVRELSDFASQLERVWVRLAEPACGCRHVGGCECLPPELQTVERPRLWAELQIVSQGCCPESCSCSPKPAAIP